MKLALCSLDSDWCNIDSNIRKLEYHIQRLKAQNCDYIIFPEMCLTGFVTNDKSQAISIPQLKEKLKDIIKESLFHRSEIIFGALTENDNLLFNSLISIENGNLKVRYNKKHLFSYANENKHISSGDLPSELNNVGYAICYDLRFPYHFNSLSESVKIVFLIASWPDKRSKHWKALLKARAIENQFYMVGVNRSGVDGEGLTYTGNNYIYDPLGKRMKSVRFDDYTEIIKIEMNKVDEVRKSFPFLNDRIR